MLSFIVPAYNEERLLGATLVALHAAAQALHEPHEIIVADDASTDGTVGVARQHGAHVVTVSRRQIAATRNAGAREALGGYLFFVDADTVVTPQALRAAVQALRDGAAGGGAAVRFDGTVPLHAQVLLRIVMTTFRLVRLAAGCFLFCTRAAFEAAGGFDETLYASEELTMSRALKAQGRFVVLREAVITSGRKARMYSGRELLLVTCRLVLRGRAGVRQRQGLELWYSGRRDDPQDAGSRSG